MAGIKHAFNSTVTDGSNEALVRPSNWNADHVIEDGAIAESKLVISDNTTANASTTAHGFLPKLPNDSAQFLNGVGSFSTVESGGGDILGRTFVTPTLSEFSWVNQDSSSAEQADKYVTLSHAADGVNECYMLKKSLPYSTYQLTMGFYYYMYSTYNRAGIGIRQSSDGKILGCNFMQQATQLQACAHKWNTATSWNGNSIEYYIPNWPNFLRIVNNGANRLYYYSMDCIYWRQFWSEAYNYFMTENEVGFLIESESSYPVEVTVFHFELIEL